MEHNKHRHSPEAVSEQTQRAAARRKILSQIREVRETSSVPTLAELLSKGNWIAIASLPDAVPCRFILGRISD